MAFLLRGERVLHWRSDGPNDRPAVVFANSLGTDFRIWDAMLPALADRYRLIRYDKAGHGLSDTAAGPHALEDHVEDLLAVLDAAEVRAAAIVGVSFGGLIAQGVALWAPGRVTALVLCDTAARIGSPALWEARIAAIGASGLAAIADGILERWFSAGFRRDRTTELAGWRNMLVRTPADGYAATCAAIRDADLTGAVAAIRAPALCLVGDEDGATPPDIVRATAALIPGARFEIIPGAGHLPCIEQPALLADLILHHLAEAGHA